MTDNNQIKQKPVFKHTNLELAGMLELIAANDALIGLHIGQKGNMLVPCSQVLQEVAHRISRIDDDKTFDAAEGSEDSN